MSKLSWAIVCCLVIFNSAALTVDSTSSVMGAGCKEYECQDASIEYNECAHFGDNDPCRSDYCVKNIEYFPKCPTDGESDAGCPVEMDDFAERNKTYFRYANNCTTGNPSEWNRIEFSDPCWLGLAYETRCEAGGCSGAEVLGVVTEPVLGRNVCKPWCR